MKKKIIVTDNLIEKHFPKLNTAMFRWDNSSRATFTSTLRLWDSWESKPGEDYNIVGWTKASQVPVCPREDDNFIVVMFEDKETFENVWTHLLKESFEEYIERLEANKVNL